jgi:hypothetical protein
MKVNKNEFVLLYDPTNRDEFSLALVESDSEAEALEANMIMFSRASPSLMFEPVGERIIKKDLIIKIQKSLIMFSSENEQIVQVQYELHESLFFS